MKPAKYDEVTSQMNSLLYTLYFDSRLFEPSIAYTVCSAKSVLGEIYRIYINSSDVKLTPYLYVHECGHILFGHMRCMESREDAFLKEKLQGTFHRIKKYFDCDYQKFFECFTEVIFNVVMDFEVNSRMFSAEEWEFMQERTRLLLSNDAVSGQWPLDYGFPPGRTWNEYLNMILLDIEKFILYFRIESKINHLRRCPNFNGVLTENEYEKIKRECAHGKFSKRERDDLEKLSKHHSNKFAVPNGNMSGHSSGDSASQTKICFQSYSGMPHLLSKIKRLLFVNRSLPSLRNQLYNTNRRKYSSNVIIPKTVKYSCPKRPNLYLLIDVSGSVDSRMVHDFFKTFQTVKNEFKHTKIVFWSHCYNGECTLEDEIPDLYGGGTNIAKGINYMKTHFEIKEKDVFFVISDFDDNLEDWQAALKDMKCRLYAINWAAWNTPPQNPGFLEILTNR